MHPERLTRSAITGRAACGAPRLYDVRLASDPNTVDPRLSSALDEDLVAALLAWQQEKGAQIVLQRMLDGGYTRARVGSVVVDFVSGPVHKYILKAVPTGDRGTKEGGAHGNALASGPREFADAHLVEQPFAPHESEAGGMLMFQGIAGGDLSTFRPLANLYDSAELPTVAATIVKSLLEEWAPDPSVERMTAWECVRKQLGHRGQPGDAVDRWARIVGDGAQSRWLQFEADGQARPNPLTWLADQAGADDRLLIVHHGRAHGDLHLDNIFLQLSPEADAASYRLIDLSEWDEHAPLCRDIPHLLLATIGKHLSSLSSRRRRLLAGRVVDAAVGAPTGPGTLQGQGLEQLTDQLLHAGDEWAAEQSMLDDWRLQLLLGVIAAALIQASVSAHAPDSRWWFFELAALALAHLDGVAAEPRWEDEIALVGPAGAHHPNVAAVAERLDDVVSGFGGRKSTVLVIGEAGLSDAAVVSRQSWDLVVEFDPATDSTGAYSQRAAAHEHRLVTFAQEAAFGPQTTVWLAADGIEGGQRGPAELRMWRRECLPGIQDAVRAFAASGTRPVVICTAGPLGGKARAVVEALLDVFTARAELLSLEPGTAPELLEYSPEVLGADPVSVLSSLPDRTAPEGPSREITLPGVDGPVAVAENDLAWLARSGEVLHSGLGRSARSEGVVGEGFYRGGKISWLELDIGADVQRELTDEIAMATTRDLKNRDTRRISLHHYPGAGGTTVSRRVAWDLHDDHPVLIAEKVTDHVALADRIRRLHTLTGQAVLVVFESTLDAVIDRTYAAVRADSVPCVLLIVERRAEGAGGDRGERTFYVDVLSENERRNFVDVFGGRVPDRHPDLRRLAASLETKVVPFLFGLTTYEHDYVALAPYVSRSLERLSGPEMEALKVIGLVHNYAGLPLPSVLLADALNVSDERDVELRELVSSDLLSLLVEGRPEEWRTVHNLIAREVLVQLLAPPDPAAARAADSWKIGLSTLAANLITQSAEEFGEFLPDDVRTIIDQLFIVRNNKAVFTGERETFSELLGDIPAAEGRIGVLRSLAQRFPEEPHFWAHLGRMLSYTARDHGAALDAIDRAINLDGEDDALFHMKGMILRNKSRSVKSNQERLHPWALRDRVLEVVEEARRQFEHSIELNDVSEYGHVALVQLCIEAINFGRAQSPAGNYSAFLADRDSTDYREMLALAEEHLDRIREIRGGDRPSRYSAAVEAEIQAFYDDYAALLQGWRNLLDRYDLAKPPIRRQLVHAYRRRAGSWRAANSDERARAMELLEQNLRDDPADTRSLMEWLRVSRFRAPSLDRASELVQYSVRDPATTPRDVLFYDYVISGLLAIGGRDTAVNEYRRKVERSRDRGASFGNRRFVYEWYTAGAALGQLVHHGDLRDWERSAGGRDPGLLGRLDGRVHKIARPQAGEIEFGPGLRAFFTPAAAQLVGDRHTNARVSFLLGFSYEGPQAWSVRLIDA